MAFADKGCIGLGGSSSGRCGNLFGKCTGKYSGAANPEYCNEASGWCGTAQDSTMILAPAQRQPRLKLNNEIV